MIARFLSALALIVLAPPVGSAPVNWARVSARTPEGGIRVGNPNARVRFVEIANYTCPHCAHFSQAGAATLATRIRAGTLAVEYRPLTSNNVSLAATIVARCAPAPVFHAVNDALYARQAVWLKQAYSYAQVNDRELSSYTELDQLQQIAEQGGIRAVAVAAGMPAARVAACFADAAQLEDTLRAVQAASAITGSTPTFLFAGQKLEGATWPEMSTRLRAAGL